MSDGVSQIRTILKPRHNFNAKQTKCQMLLVELRSFSNQTEFQYNNVAY